MIRAHRLAVAVAAALCAVPAVAAAQQASLQGIVASAGTGAPLEGAAVVLESAGRQVHGTFADRNGFYQIGGIAAGAYTLRARGVGHAEQQRAIALAPGQRVTLRLELEPAAVALEGVVVTPERGAAVRDLGRQRVTPADLRAVPTPAGSGDLATYIQTLPGVTTTGDRGGQLFVRGGTPAENLVLVDGIPIYQPFHILGFFSVFPEDLVSSADFYAGGFGARYSGRTSSVLDVALRDGDPTGFRAFGAASPFLVEALAEGPATSDISWLVSARRSLVEETSGALLGRKQPITFESQLVKVTVTEGDEIRCSALALRTSDRGRLDPDEADSHVAWANLVFGGRCVTQLHRFVRLVEVGFSSSSLDNSAVSRGSSRFSSRVWRMQHDLHSTSMLASVPIYAGYQLHYDLTEFDLTELFGLQRDDGEILGASGYLEAALQAGGRFEVRPGVALTAAPRIGAEPRLRASWQPFGRSSEKVQGAVGLYRQDLTGTSDLRDVGSVFTAWMRPRGERPTVAVHAMLGWQQSLGGGLRWSVEGYHKRLRDVPVPAWQAVAQFTTRLDRADGTVYGADTRIELSRPGFYGFVGYGYGWTRYETRDDAFGRWFGEPVQGYHPPHDRRHQVNAVTNLELAGFDASARWQLGTGLPFSRPVGFDEAFDPTADFHDVTTDVGTPRLVLDRPFTARMPLVHRLDLSVERGWDLRRGRLTAQAGVVNAYDRRNMFYYDLFTGRRVDQLPLAPYASLAFRGR